MPILAIDFCPSGGGDTKQHVPEGDNRARAVCRHCDTIHYQNPKIVAGTLPVWKDRVLLCKRSIEPRYGTWTLPAGFMENGETVEQGAARETIEEAQSKMPAPWTVAPSLFDEQWSMGQAYLDYIVSLQPK